MDGRRFDDLSKTLARGTSRRRVLKALAGGLIGGFGGLAGSPRPTDAAGCKRQGKRCTADDDCCSGVCEFDKRGRGRCGDCPDQDCAQHEYFDPRDCQCHCQYDRDICGPGTVCTKPTGCEVGCPSGFSLCAGRCISDTECCTADDCGAQQHCDTGACVCDAGYHFCGGTCVSNSDVATCGTACTPCSVPANGSATCDGTSCVMHCDPGTTPLADVCCLNVNVCGDTCLPAPCDSSQCLTCNETTGACATICADDQTCCGGACKQKNLASCTENADCCSEVCVDQVCAATCREADETCDGAGDCCAGLTCVAGQNVCCASGVACDDGCCATAQVICDTDHHCCLPDDDATTCAGHCGEVTNNCGQTVVCPGCSACQTCTDQHVCGAVDDQTDCGANGICCSGLCVENGECCAAGNCPSCQVCTDQHACEVIDDRTNCGANGICCDGACVEDGECCAAGDCPAGPNQSAQCQAGACHLTCDTGFADCNATSDDGCETDILNDPDNCNGCGHACTTTDPNATPICTAGQCDIACTAGWTLIDETCCQNEQVCGAAGAQHCCGASEACIAGQCCPNSEICGSGDAETCCDPATHVCSDGVCCPTGSLNCGDGACTAGTCCSDDDCAAGQGCCGHTCVELTTNENCGACGVPCSVADSKVLSVSCATGTCKIDQCKYPYGDCDGDPANGCEPILDNNCVCTTNPDNCPDPLTCNPDTGNCEAHNPGICTTPGTICSSSRYCECALTADFNPFCWGSSPNGRCTSEYDPGGVCETDLDCQIYGPGYACILNYYCASGRACAAPC